MQSLRSGSKARLDRLAEVREAIVLVADREQVIVGTVNERFTVEPVERTRLQSHGGDVLIILDYDAVDRGIKMNEIIVNCLVVAVADPPIDAPRHAGNPRRHLLQVSHNG